MGDESSNFAVREVGKRSPPLQFLGMGMTGYVVESDGNVVSVRGPDKSVDLTLHSEAEAQHAARTVADILAARFREVRELEREQIYKDLCNHCRIGTPIKEWDEWNKKQSRENPILVRFEHHYGPDGIGFDECCTASRIRTRILQEEVEDERMALVALDADNLRKAEDDVPF